ncbi:MAG: hypothetical protein AAGK21_08195 [Bacteroidota bacterium]
MTRRPPCPTRGRRWAARLYLLALVLLALPVAAQAQISPLDLAEADGLDLDALGPLTADTTVVPFETPEEDAAEGTENAAGDTHAPESPAEDLLGPILLAPADPVAVADTTDDELRERPVRLTAFGYYRLFLYGRDIGNPYPNLEPFERSYGVGDGYREPMLSLSVLGRPNGRSSFGTELFLFDPYDGLDEDNSLVSLNLGVNFYGNFRTEAGNFGVRAGGIHWYNLSPFTIGVYQVLDRFSIFDRTPWEGVSGTARYDNYFRTGEANAGDARWNFQAFQGLILDGRELPGGLEADVFWGKTQPNGGLPGALTEPGALDPGDTPTYLGLSGDARALPSFIAGGRLARAFGEDHRLAFNTITSYRTLDSLTSERRQYQVHTGQFETALGDVRFSGELGASLYESPTYTSEWGEALMARAATPASLTGLPLDVQVYQVGRHFFNENGEIATNNNPQIQADPRCSAPAGAGSIGGLITQVNQLAHNRRGVNVNTAWERGPARFTVGWGLAHELAPTTTDISYVHRINGLAVSRIYNPFPADAVCATQFGPLGRKFSFFRGAFERVQLTDVEPVTGLAQNRKYYHAVDFQGKLRLEPMGTPVYLFYLGSFGSANRVARPLPTDDDTYLFVQYHELDAYVEVLDGVMLAGYLGIENARGGQFTALSDDTGEPRDQLATGIGVGVDWTLAPNAGLYLRHRWMDFEDRSFLEDTYSGRELTLELKIFF